MTDDYKKAEFDYIGDMQCRHFELADWEIARMVAEGTHLLGSFDWGGTCQEWADRNDKTDEGGC